MDMWKSSLLSLVGRVVLIRDTLTIIPFCIMQKQWIPTSIYDAINRMAKSFLWNSKLDGKGVHLVQWDIVSDAKHKKGLTIRSARENNIIMLGKGSWDVS